MTSSNLSHSGDSANRSLRLSRRARVALGIATALSALVVVFVIIGAGLSTWRGSGFRDNGPELPRLRSVLALKPGMSIADVGAGNGELTVALATEVGSNGRVYLERSRPGAGPGHGRRRPSLECHVRAIAGGQHESAGELLRRDCRAPCLPPFDRPGGDQRHPPARPPSGWCARGD